MVNTTTGRYPRSRLLTVLGIITAIMLCVFIVEKIFLPQSGMGLSKIDGVIFLGLGLSLAVAMAQYGYHAWSLDLRSFTEWYSRQQIISNQWFQDWYNSLPGWNLRSLYRLMGPIGFLIGIAIAGIGLVIIVALLFAA